MAINLISTATAINSHKEISNSSGRELCVNQLHEEELATVMDLQLCDVVAIMNSNKPYL